MYDDDSELYQDEHHSNTSVQNADAIERLLEQAKSRGESLLDEAGDRGGHALHFGGKPIDGRKTLFGIPVLSEKSGDATEEEEILLDDPIVPEELTEVGVSKDAEEDGFHDHVASMMSVEEETSAAEFILEEVSDFDLPDVLSPAPVDGRERVGEISKPVGPGVYHHTIERGADDERFRTPVPDFMKSYSPPDLSEDTWAATPPQPEIARLIPTSPRASDTPPPIKGKVHRTPSLPQPDASALLAELSEPGTAREIECSLLVSVDGKTITTVPIDEDFMKAAMDFLASYISTRTVA